MPVKPKVICSPITYDNLEIFTQGTNLPATAVNDKGENVIVSLEPSDLGVCYRLDTLQLDGWIRINRYYKNGAWDEEYDMGGER